MLFLEKEDADKDIDMYINSPGGSVTAGLAIYDTMQLIKPDVATICAGMAASHGLRSCSPAAPRESVMRFRTRRSSSISPGSQQIGGQATDVEIAARDLIARAGLAANIYEETTEEAARANPAGYRARLLHDRAGSQGLRDRRSSSFIRRQRAEPRDLNVLRPRRASREVDAARKRRGSVFRFGDEKGQLKCSFCGKSQEQVRKLIAGPGVYICDECIELCNEIIEEELYKNVDENLRLRNIPKPKEINHILNQYVIGQERAKKIAGGRGLQPLQAHQRRRNTSGMTTSSCRSRNILLVGPTGSGRPISRRRSRRFSTCRSRWPTRPR